MRWLQPDPIDIDGKDPDLYAYCGNDPINSDDPFGLEDSDKWWVVLFSRETLKYLFSKQYVGDVCKTAKGEGKAVVGTVTGPIELVMYYHKKGVSLKSTKDLAVGMWQGFWGGLTGTDPEAFGESFMTLEILLAPVLKKVPNPTPLSLSSYGNLRSFTLVNLEWKGECKFRIDVGELPTSGKRALKIPKALRGKKIPHYHRRGKGPGNGIGRHRPWEGGQQGPRF